MRVLVGCESSGKVREAFRLRGHDAYSCDFQPADDGSAAHFQSDIRYVLRHFRGYFDLFIVHPTCTFLCNSGVLHLYNADGTFNEERWESMRQGAAFFREMLDADVRYVIAENPIMHGHALALVGQRAAQFVQPWHHGDPAFKATGLWTRGGVPLLQPSRMLTPPAKGTEEHKLWSAIHRAPPGPLRWKKRSETFPGIANAFADQYGRLAA